MGAKQSCASEDSGHQGSRFYITDIFIDPDDSSGENHEILNLTELCVFGLDEGVEDAAKCYPLSRVVSGRWAMRSMTEIPRLVEGVDCIVKSEAGEDIGFVHLDHVHLATDSHKIRKPIETFDARLCLQISWEMVEIPAEADSRKPKLPSLEDMIQFAVVLYNEFQRTRRINIVSAAIVMLQRAVAIIPVDNVHLPVALSNLGGCLYARFECTGDVQDLADAVSQHRKAVQLPSDGNNDLPAWLNNLGISLQSRFNVVGDLSDICEAISVQRRAVHLTPEDHAHLPARLNNLGNSLNVRFRSTGHLPDSAEAILLQQRAVNLIPEGHPHRPALLDGLGTSLQSRFNRTSDIQDLAEAIAVERRAVYLTPEDHESLSFWLNSLGEMLRCRFDRTRDLQDVSEAVLVQRRAVELTSKGHVQLPIRLNSLGMSLQYRFRRVQDTCDLDEAIAAQKRAVQLTDEGHVNFAVYLNNLGITYFLRFETSGDLQDIDEALLAQEKAVDLTSISNEQQSSQYTNLGNSYLARYQQTGEDQDIAEALSAHQHAVEILPKTHAYAALCFKNLANCWHSWYVSSGDPGRLEESISNYRAAAACAAGTPRIRLSAATWWARLLNEHYPNSPEILSAFETVVQMVSLMAGLEQTVQRRYALLQEYSGLPLEAAAAAFRLERPDKALEWLEQGRCLVWSQQSQLRTPLDELALHDRSLSDQVLEVAGRLERAGSSSREQHIGMTSLAKVSVEDEARDHVHLAREWDDLLVKVRAVPGFEDFLRPPSFSTLVQHTPTSGSIVVINVHESRCDAVALQAGSRDPVHIPLPGFSLEKASRYRGLLSSQLQAQGLRLRGNHIESGEDDETQARALRRHTRVPRQGDCGIRHVLEGLWKEVVKPIMDTLGILKGDSFANATLPRMWWCPTGPLTFLPIHAAGIYRRQDSESLLDYVVSSFTPTVTALTSRVKSKPQSFREAGSGLFLTCQPRAPGASPILGTIKEVGSVYGSAVSRGIRVLKVEGDALTVDQCLARMEEFSSVHLACHASQNINEPLLSRFIFHNGYMDLKTIARRNIKHADLAFLSACQTSAGEATLSDEAVHLAAGMLAAGYCRVVATMWAIDDRYAPQVAVDFYQYLWANQGVSDESQFDGTLTAYALHHATQQLRRRLNDLETSLLTWTPYIHYGY